MRYFVSFKKNTSASDKLMVFVGMPRSNVQDIMQENYKDLWHKIYTEQEVSIVLPQIYCQEHLWIKFGSEVKLTENQHEVSVKSITDWFKTAKPEPVTGFPTKWINTQLGAHFEEVAEMVKVFKDQDSDLDLADLAFKAHSLLVQMSQHLYESDDKINLNQEDKVELLDSLADQVVTATGVSYFSKFKFDEALTEVNKSNYSKFENGKPVLNENGKIIKGKDYFKPELKDYV